MRNNSYLSYYFKSTSKCGQMSGNCAHCHMWTMAMSGIILTDFWHGSIKSLEHVKQFDQMKNSRECREITRTADACCKSNMKSPTETPPLLVRETNLPLIPRSDATVGHYFVIGWGVSLVKRGEHKECEGSCKKELHPRLLCLPVPE